MTASRPTPTTAALPSANDGDADIIELPPLTETEAARAVQQLLPQIDPFIASEVQRHAGGNPLFIEELCHAAADAGEGQGAMAAGQSSAAWLAARPAGLADAGPAVRARALAPARAPARMD